MKARGAGRDRDSPSLFKREPGANPGGPPAPPHPPESGAERADERPLATSSPISVISCPPRATLGQEAASCLKFPVLPWEARPGCE